MCIAHHAGSQCICGISIQWSGFYLLRLCVARRSGGVSFLWCSPGGPRPLTRTRGEGNARHLRCLSLICCYPRHKSMQIPTSRLHTNLSYSDLFPRPSVRALFSCIRGVSGGGGQRTGRGSRGAYPQTLTACHVRTKGSAAFLLGGSSDGRHRQLCRVADGGGEPRGGPHGRG